VLRALSNLVWNVSRDGASTASLGNPFQRFTSLIVKNFFLISSLNLPCFSLKPLPLVLSLLSLLKETRRDAACSQARERQKPALPISSLMPWALGIAGIKTESEAGWVIWSLFCSAPSLR